MTKFSLGQIVATPGALDLLERHGEAAEKYLLRHVNGDWGELSASDKKLNNAAVKNGERILSSYDVHGEKLWIITEWDRSVTTLLLPSEY